MTIEMILPFVIGMGIFRMFMAFPREEPPTYGHRTTTFLLLLYIALKLSTIGN